MEEYIGILHTWILSIIQISLPDHKSFGEGGQLNGLLLCKEHLKNDFKKETVAGKVNTKDKNSAINMCSPKWV